MPGDAFLPPEQESWPEQIEYSGCLKFQSLVSSKNKPQKTKMVEAQEERRFG